MTSVYSLNTTPPSIESSTWSGVTGNATLYVPSDEAVAAYEIANYWNNFKSIEKIFDNRAFPKEWSEGKIAGKCASNCTHCGKCTEVRGGSDAA